jgi:hypothetical protein
MYVNHGGLSEVRGVVLQFIHLHSHSEVDVLSDK